MLHARKIKHRDKFPNVLSFLDFKGERIRRLEKHGNVGVGSEGMIVLRCSVKRLEHEGNVSCG